MSWDNWGFGGRTSRAQAANDFLNNGTVNTIFGGSGCRSSQDCASGFACVGGRCVQKSSQESSDGGSTCGEGAGGGGCNATVTQGMTEQDAANRGFSWSGGVGTKSMQWVPVYAADGCTVTGCSLASCGGGNANEPDCPAGQRSCRYDAYGTVNCFCGPPEPQGCSRFCTNYFKSTGEVAGGCDNLTCDECSYCDEIYVSGTGVCRDSPAGVPCHCNPQSVPACHTCNEIGQIVKDYDNCFECVTISNFDCGCGIALSKTCCQPYGTPGLTLMNKCQNELAEQCAEECGNTPPVDPCAGDCISKTICQSGGCPDVPPNEPGKRNTQTGCIEAGGEGCTIYNECDMTNVPDYCKPCDCNCHNDCPDCELCGADGKCYPDPSCTDCNDGSFCPGAWPNGCCDQGETCYAPENGIVESGCCDESIDEIVEFYRLYYDGGGDGNYSSLLTDGTPQISYNHKCINCAGDTVPCDSPCARPTMTVLNYRSSVSQCRPTSTISIAFEDSVAASCCNVGPGWGGIATPDTYNEFDSRNCCPKPI